MLTPTNSPLCSAGPAESTVFPKIIPITIANIIQMTKNRSRKDRPLNGGNRVSWTSSFPKYWIRTCPFAFIHSSIHTCIPKTHPKCHGPPPPLPFQRPRSSLAMLLDRLYSLFTSAFVSLGILNFDLLTTNPFYIYSWVFSNLPIRAGEGVTGAKRLTGR